MPTEYPVLDGRPIDQWRVTELKEELKRRKLITRGLKDDLIKRLDEAIRQDEESFEEEGSDTEIAKNTMQPEENKTVEVEETLQYDHNNTKVDDTATMDATGEDDATKPQHEEITESTMQFDSATIGVNCMNEVENSKYDQMTGDVMQVDENKTSKVNAPTSAFDKDLVTLGQVNVDEKEDLGSNNNTGIGVEVLVEEASMKADITVNEVIFTTTVLSEKINMEKEDSKPSQIDAALDTSDSTKQVYEASHDLGSQVKCVSFYNESVSMFEKFELGGNLNANNINLELDVVKPVDETEDNQSIDVDYSKRDDSADGESLKNSQQYKTDNCVEEELMETKQIGRNYNYNEVDNKNEVSEVTVLKNECLVGEVGPELPHGEVEINAEKKSTSAASTKDKTLQDAKEPLDMDSSKSNDTKDGVYMEKLNFDNFPDDDFMEEEALETNQVNLNNNNQAGEEISSDKKGIDAAPSDKRKLQDEAIDEPPKRQRKWNSESIKVHQPQSIKPHTAPPKDSSNTAKLESNFGISDSTVSVDLPKRVVPPSLKPPTSSLRIDHFLRPFTLKAVQELLAKTGNVCNFWMDNIKTHCYVTYSTVEEASETRNSVYNLQWPPNGGRLLVAEFVDPQEVKMRVEAPLQSPATPMPITPSPQPTQSARQQGTVLSNPHPARRERHIVPSEKQEPPPILSLDDLFKKTRATPRIYYLPLDEQHVAAKLGRREKQAK